MISKLRRRRFIERVLAMGALATLGSGATPTALAGQKSQALAAALSKEEKDRLKAELQRELERKVYSVDEALFRKVNRARTSGRYEGHERSHVPKIVAPARVRRLEAFTARVEVGAEEIHEMQPFHYVDWIGLRVEGLQVCFASVTPLFNRPIVTFELVLEESAALVAQEHCNLHGTWESEPWHVRVEPASQ